MIPSTVFELPWLKFRGLTHSFTLMVSQACDKAQEYWVVHHKLYIPCVAQDWDLCGLLGKHIFIHIRAKKLIFQCLEVGNVTAANCGICNIKLDK